MLDVENRLSAWRNFHDGLCAAQSELRMARSSSACVPKTWAISSRLRHVRQKKRTWPCDQVLDSSGGP